MFGSRDGSADVREDTSFGDGGVVEQLVEFLIVSDGQENVSGDNSGLLVVLGSVSSQLQDLSSEVFEHCSEVDGSTCTDSLSVVGMSEKTADSADWELEACS